MAFRGANLLNRAMTQREVDLSSGFARSLGREAGPREQALRHAVVASILREAREPPIRETALPAKARDQPQFFKRSQVGQGGRWPHAEPGGDILQARPAGVALTVSDDSKGLHLSMGELLERLHAADEPSRVYMCTSNY